MPVSHRKTSPPQAPPDADQWLDSLPAAVIGVDRSERVRFVNAAAAELLVPAGRGLQGRLLAEVFGEEGALVSIVRRAILGQAAVGEFDVSLSGPGFLLGRAAVTAAPVGDRGYIGVVIHPMGRMRSSALHGAAVRTLAHEVRNPLAGIRAAAQLIAKSEGAEHGPLTALIVEEADRIQRLTERMDPRGQAAAAPFATLNIHETLERVRQVVAASFPDIAIRERYDPSLPEIQGDFDQLIQAFLNIAKNAAEAARLCSDGGEIIFSTRYLPGLRIRSAHGGASRAQLEITVSDNGPGVDPAVVDRVFEPFATTKPKGMGLGLTVAADIIARHEGRIEVESAPGATAFRALLPIAPARTTEDA
ncbi:MAG: PAS domain-containing protein [Alphaproteobacteria bacterium]|nr:PAS domain-containing protein [Alphaproteobacteria bacterium]